MEGRRRAKRKDKRGRAGGGESRENLKDPQRSNSFILTSGMSKQEWENASVSLYF